ncbi:MAG: exosortase/archaeosortase family protein [Pirellulales bacterium]
MPRTPSGTSRDHLVNVAIVVGLGLVLAVVYAPLLLWLGRTTLQASQLHNGGLIVLFALVIGLRKLIRHRSVAAEFSPLGLGLIIAGLACLYLLKLLPGLAPLLAMTSFCLSFAGVTAFLFGRQGVKALLPAIVGVLLLGVLAGLAPQLDWPLRGLAANYSAAVLDRLGMNVAIEWLPGQPPRLSLVVGNQPFVVAAECNGFGLLTSSLLAAAVLGFYYDLKGRERVGLLLLAAPLAIAFNALRIVGITLTATYLPLPYTLIHEGVGLLFYAAALLILWWLARRRAEEEGVMG